MAKSKSLRQIEEDFDYLENFQPVKNIGKLARKVRLDSMDSKKEKFQKSKSKKFRKGNDDEN